MPLTMANSGEQNVIKKIGGKAETRHHLENLGFVAGAPIVLIAEIAGNVIVNVKESRIAISREMASRIIV